MNVMPDASVDQTTDAGAKAGCGRGGFGDSGCKAELGPEGLRAS